MRLQQIQVAAHRESLEVMPLRLAQIAQETFAYRLDKHHDSALGHYEFVPQGWPQAFKTTGPGALVHLRAGEPVTTGRTYRRLPEGGLAEGGFGFG